MMAAGSGGISLLVKKEEIGATSATQEDNMLTGSNRKDQSKTTSSNTSSTAAAAASYVRHDRSKNEDLTSVEEVSSLNNLSRTNAGDQKETRMKIPIAPVERTESSTENGTSNDHEIDDALLSALANPSERFALLRLEKVLCDFMKDPCPCIEVGGPSNSTVVYPGQLPTQQPQKQSRFQRLCLHRLADRFCIVRENGTELDNGGPGLIRLVKTEESRIPQQLLIDLREYQDGENKDGITRSMSELVLGKATPNRKMKIMKRSNSGIVEGSRGASKGRGGKSVKGKPRTDKEKAYAEARARIFNNSETTNSESERRGSIGSMSNNFGGSAVSSCFSSAVTSPSTTPPPPAVSQLSPPPSVTDEVDGKMPRESNGNRPPASNVGVSKATWRNRQQEENDPDFQTRHRMQAPQTWSGGGVNDYGAPVFHAMPPYHVPTHYYGAAPAPGTSYYPPPPHYVQQQMVMTNSSNNGSQRGGRGAYGQTYGEQSSGVGSSQAGDASQPADINCTEEFPSLR